MKSIEAANMLLGKTKTLKENDLFIFVLSGGASAMIEKPIEGLSLEEFMKISSSLLTSGIDITALNIVRKALAQDTVSPEFQWTNQFHLPSDPWCLRVLQMQQKD